MNESTGERQQMWMIPTSQLLLKVPPLREAINFRVVEALRAERSRTEDGITGSEIPEIAVVFGNGRETAIVGHHDVRPPPSHGRGLSQHRVRRNGGRSLTGCGPLTDAPRHHAAIMPFGPRRACDQCVKVLDGVLQQPGLAAEFVGGTGRLLRARRIALRHLVHLRHGDAHVGDPLGLLLGGSSDLGNQGVRLGDLTNDPLQRFTNCHAAS